MSKTPHTSEVGYFENEDSACYIPGVKVKIESENENQEANDTKAGIKRDYGMHYKFGSLQGVSNVRSDFFLA